MLNNMKTIFVLTEVNKGVNNLIFLISYVPNFLNSLQKLNLPMNLLQFSSYYY